MIIYFLLSNCVTSISLSLTYFNYFDVIKIVAHDYCCYYHYVTRSSTSYRQQVNDRCEMLSHFWHRASCT